MKVTFNKEIGIRLNQFILILNISQNAFAQSIGVTKGYLNDVVNGRRGIGSVILINTAKAYHDLNIRWLITGEGEMYEPASGHYATPGSWEILPACTGIVGKIPE